MTKVIIIFGIVLLLFAGYVFYQFSMNQTPSTKQITINDQTFTAEVVTKAKDQQIGLTKYDSLPKEKAMLFEFSQATEHNFWMRNMKFPIDIIFLNEKKVVGVVENAQPVQATEENIPTFGAGITSDAVLEITAGLAKQYNIKEGDTVTIK